ncbi:MAG: PD-(D/E)XK nuclease family protein [Gammaproteobacteria bacterium]|nr:PD-(D/E)XK nuclease family protein [Gammaproteobacteria bacterium]
MTTPNIFDFAKSELSQDAVLAYMLKWADPIHAHEKETRAMHNLGKDFLRTLLDCTRKGLPKRMRFKKISVEGQMKTRKIPEKKGPGIVDVQVEVNDSICLLIEDKVFAERHGEQIKRYTKYADTECKDVRPIYLKTGNESPHTRRPTENICFERNGGYFYRKDLLRVLNRHTKTGIRFINDFRLHLQKMEDATQNFLGIPVDKWDWNEYEGYYIALENTQGMDCNGWGSVSRAGTHAFWTSGHENTKRVKCGVYLQIDPDHSVSIRCAARPADGKTKVTPALREYMFGKAETRLSKFRGMRLEWWGKVGKTAGIAKVHFIPKKGGAYMVLNGNGTVNFPRTVNRLKKAVRLVEAVSK